MTIFVIYLFTSDLISLEIFSFSVEKMKTLSYIAFFLFVIMLLEIAISSASNFQSYGSKVFLLLFTGSTKTKCMTAHWLASK